MHYRSKIIYFLLLALFGQISLLPVFAGDIYPYSFHTAENHDGGEIFVLGDSTSDIPDIVFIKPNWGDETEYFYSWKGFERENAIGSSLPNAEILSAKSFGNHIDILWKSGGEYFVSELGRTLNFKNTLKIDLDIDPYANINSKWIGELKDGRKLLLLNSSLLLIEPSSFEVVDNDIMAACIIDENTAESNYGKNTHSDKKNSSNLKSNSNIKYEFACLKSFETTAVLYIFDSFSNKFEVERLEKNDKMFLKSIGREIAAVSEYLSESLIQLIDIEKVIDIEKGDATPMWAGAKASLLEIVKNGGEIDVLFLAGHDKGYALNIEPLTGESATGSSIAGSKKIIQLPYELMDPIGLYEESGIIFLLFRNGIASVDFEGELLSVDYLQLGQRFASMPRLVFADNSLVLSAADFSQILKRSENKYWYINRFLRNTGDYLFPSIAIIIILILIQMYRHQKRILKAILELPAAGVVFVIDKSGHLKKINGPGKDILGINESIPMGRQFHFYCSRTRTQPLMEIIEKGMKLKESFNQKLNITHNGESKEWYCTIVVLTNVTGNFRGLVFTGIDITEELERKRLSNWAQLAHDMQTNLSTIRLNAEKLEVEPGSNDHSRRKKIIHQVNLLIHRVRDIVTVGRSDRLDKEVIFAGEICIEARNEFDDEMFPYVEFILNIDNFQIECDKQKIIRAIRNAIENGIKALQEKQGSITISCSRDSRNAYFSIKDSGIGLDSESRKKILTPYFSTSKHRGGTGIGTMIMQHVAELHGGDITINSELGKGTEIIFKIPNRI